MGREEQRRNEQLPRLSVIHLDSCQIILRNKKIIIINENNLILDSNIIKMMFPDSAPVTGTFTLFSTFQHADCLLV